MTEVDPIDRMTWSAVLRIRAMHNEAQAKLGLPITDHSKRSPWEQRGETS